MGLSGKDNIVESIDEKIIDINLEPVKKTKVRINGDQNMILELNLSDMGIVGRLKTAYKKLQNLSSRVASLSDEMSGLENDEETLDMIDKKLTELDKEMRNEIDTLFDSNVSEVCLPYGTMYDPHGGEFMYEHIIDALSELYENNFNAEFKAMRNRVKKHTDKYTKK